MTRPATEAPGGERATESVEILFFARLRRVAGRDRTTAHLPAGTTVRELARRLEHDITDLTLDGTLIAVNEAYANETTELRDGDTVAFLPPVSGG